MAEICEAIYEDGIFRPIAPLPKDLVNGQHVRLVVNPDTPEDILRLATEVYSNLTEEDVADIEKIALDRSSFFTDPAS
jgi:predicted DNA-binding antitoxin AbrB/MazE fold protein